MEYVSLIQPGQMPLGMILLPNEASPLIWRGVWFLHQGYYAGAILKFNILFPSVYPEQPPALFFTTPIFHPLVRSDGLFNHKHNLPHWRPKEHKVVHILYVLKSCFKRSGLDRMKERDTWNREAYQMLTRSEASFKALATQEVTLSQSTSHLHQSDHPALRGSHGKDLSFRQIKPSDASDLRNRFGLRDWAHDS